MLKVWLIARREYLERVRTRAFAVMTVLIPVLMGGLVFGGSYLASRTRPTGPIAVVAEDAGFAGDLKREIEAGADAAVPAAGGGMMGAAAPAVVHRRVEVWPATEATRVRLEAELADRGSLLGGYLWVSGGAEPVYRWRPRSAGDEATERALKVAIKAARIRERLVTAGVGGAEAEALLGPVELDTSATGNTHTALGAAYLLFFLMYMVIMLYGMNTARSIIEEKTSRVFEVMLATIRPDQMLAGKILGVGAVGLTQVGVWMVAAGLLAATPFATAMAGGAGHAVLHPAQLFFFVAYFVYGFLLYSSIAAALGAMTNSEQELQQMNMFLVLPLAFCMLMSFSVQGSPDSTLARVVSLIPFCSPLLMEFRISLGTPQPWEIGLSFVLMTATILGLLWVASRIYRVGILMYGKKPSFAEMVRWLRYS